MPAPYMEYNSWRTQPRLHRYSCRGGPPREAAVQLPEGSAQTPLGIPSRSLARLSEPSIGNGCGFLGRGSRVGRDAGEPLPSPPRVLVSRLPQQCPQASQEPGEPTYNKLFLVWLDSATSPAPPPPAGVPCCLPRLHSFAKCAELRRSRAHANLAEGLCARARVGFPGRRGGESQTPESRDGRAHRAQVSVNPAF